jgi:SAM-dependent methyltransferase
MVKTAADPDPRLSSFYADLTSLELILGTLAQEGVDTARLSARDLYSRNLDCQNLGAFPVLEVIARVLDEYGPAKPGERVLDVGCGIGGPGRFLVDRQGCRVVGVDLLPLRVETAQALAQKVGMADRVTYRVADATALPFGDGEFSQVWMLDASIHVREKARLFDELARVLRAGGLLVLHDMPGPLPRSMASASRRAPYYAPTLPQLIRQLEHAGLRLLTWRDTTPLVLADFEQKRAAVDKAGAELEGKAVPEQVRRRLARGRKLIHDYLDALGRDGVACGILIARR